MESRNPDPIKVLLAVAFYCCVTLCVLGKPTLIIESIAKDVLPKSNDITKKASTLDCKPIEYAMKDVVFLKNDYLFLKKENITIPSTGYQKEGEKIFACPSQQNIHSTERKLNCTDKFRFDNSEFKVLPNMSALLQGIIIEPIEYTLKGKYLFVCALDYPDVDEDGSRGITLMDEVSAYAGITGASISFVALIAHLFTFYFVPNLRNLPGFNLASLSIAFLLGYFFLLIGQIPDVLGLSCVISGILQQNFFLAAFFCMNVLAFDVWRILKLSTKKLAVGSQNTRKRQFIWYSLYAWGCPLIITIASVVVDNSDSSPDSIKPFYGEKDTCWMTNDNAKLIFLTAPALTMVIVNGIFFLRSSWMISSNTMKCTNDQNKQTAQLNYILYLRLGIMMGLTWTTSVIATISDNDIVWFISDLLNSLQGLFLFLLFTCTKKVLKHLKEKTSFKKNFTEKETTLSSNNFSSTKDNQPETIFQ